MQELPVGDPAPPVKQRSVPEFGAGLAVRYVLLAIGVFGMITAVGASNWIAFVVVAAATALVLITYATGRLIPLKYLLPGILLLLMFQLYPVLYTFSTAFTNAADGNRGSKDQAIEDITVGGPVTQAEDSPIYTLGVAVEAGSDPATAPFVYFLVDQDGSVFLGEESGLSDVDSGDVTVENGRVTAADGYTFLNGEQINARDAEFTEFQVPAGDNQAVQKVGLSGAFLGRTQFVYDEASDTITDTNTDTVYVADDDEGQWVPENGEGPALAQGWQVLVGLDNFSRVLTNDTIRNSFIGILVWNIAFAFLSVLTTFILGLLLAVALDNPRLKGQRITRSLMLLPYALPAFITALVWASMFNRDFGLINNVTGLDVNWLGNPVVGEVRHPAGEPLARLPVHVHRLHGRPAVHPR